MLKSRVVCFAIALGFSLFSCTLEDTQLCEEEGLLSVLDQWAKSNTGFVSMDVGVIRAVIPVYPIASTTNVWCV